MVLLQNAIKGVRELRMNNETPILIIDSEIGTFALAKRLLPDGYDLHSCQNLASAYGQCKKLQPVIILLNIDNARDESKAIIDTLHEVCEKRPSILCLSTSDSDTTRLSIYKYGGDDFLQIPLSQEELKAKLERLKAFHLQQRSLEVTNQQVTQAVMTAMTEASQYGGVLRFFNKMYQSQNTEQIRDCFFDLMKDFNLKSSIQFRTEGTVTYDSTGKDPRPIELQVYENMHADGRLIPFSKRLMVNGIYVSFIIKNMPVDDELAIGRFRDILSVISEGLDSKATDLQRLALLRQTANEVASSSKRLSTVVDSHEQFIVNAMNHVISEINASFDTLELTEQQEAFFTTLTENVLNGVEESFIHIGNEQDVMNCLSLSLHTVVGNRLDTK